MIMYIYIHGEPRRYRGRDTIMKINEHTEKSNRPFNVGTHAAVVTVGVDADTSCTAHSTFHVFRLIYNMNTLYTQQQTN